MARKILFVLIALLLATGIVFAAQQPAPYPAAFWVNGLITAGNTGLADADIASISVIFFEDPANYLNKYALSRQKINGKFSINAMDDLGMLPLKVQNYYVGTQQYVINGKNYGVNRRDIQLESDDLGKGYKNLPFDLVVEENGGMLPPVVFPINIAREKDTAGSGVIISWDKTKIITPTIYYMTGNGTGQYKNNFDNNLWKVAGRFENGILVIKDNQFDKVTEDSIRHKAQVGQSFEEVYYKATTDDPINNSKIFETAPAVGKFLATIYSSGKYNMIGVPFIIQSKGDIDSVLSTELRKNGIELLKFNNSTQQYTGMYYEGAWKGATAYLSAGEGIWVYNPTSNNIISTIVGNVPELNKDIKSNLYGPAKYNMVSIPHPQGGALTKLKLDPLAESEVLVFDNEKQSYSGTYVSGNAWKEDKLIAPAKAFWYYQKGADAKWTTKVE
ncbi:MAG: hypothetical protein FD145_924 [Candidatus Saganbacteria bacterium]|uniref:Uncharacterized protein n=1 Tax=Candidatus Saganbacteria bacterium TaxID=2575572 RepID=A0A833P344_UNCSA|nr:MAG: hypothetical protein FD145_924 [Candidatus Saganbacteria bacterium]